MSPAPTAPLRVAVFASGSGSTFQALLDYSRSRPEQPGGAAAPWTIVLLVTDRERPGAADRAEAAGVEWHRIADQDRDRAQVSAETLALLERSQVDIVLLAGYLRLIPEAVVAQYDGRMLNTHPALLPAFGGKGMYGKHVHTAVVEAGVRISGPTVHLVDPQYDRGLPLAQWPVPVMVDDDPASLAARVQAVERWLYPQAVDHLARALLEGHSVLPMPFTGSAFSIPPSDKPATP